MTEDKMTEFFLTQNIKKGRAGLEKDYAKNFETQEKTLSIIVSGLEHANHNKFTTASTVWNISGYINLISYDLKIISRDLTFAGKDWEKRLYARQAFLLIYESMNDLLRLLGKNLLNEINQFSDAEAYKQKVKTITSRLNEFKAEYEPVIKVVRHNTIAHRDTDMLVQLKAIQSIKWVEAIKIVTKFDGILSDLGGVCQHLMNRTNDQLGSAK
jgi:hypothetical protein